ncbi:MAG: hypothetical protein ACI9UD_001956, partial [Glaciecola sp.]
YIKEWHGKEDNEHLVDVLAETDSNVNDYADAIYQQLKNRYPS